MGSSVCVTQFSTVPSSIDQLKGIVKFKTVVALVDAFVRSAHARRSRYPILLSVHQSPPSR